MAFNPNPTQEPANSTIGGGQGFNGSTTEGAAQNDPGVAVEDWGGSLSSEPYDAGRIRRHPGKCQYAGARRSVREERNPLYELC